MKKLLNTQLFCLLKKADGVFKFNKQELRSAYEDFVYKVTALCLSKKGDIPAYFIIHYTRLELEESLTLLSHKGEEKKCSNPKLYH